jgi:hypothetical protein
MLQPIKFANAVTVVCVICQILYIIFINVVPNLVYTYMASMVPGYNFSSLESKENINFGLAFLGVILMAVSVWIFTYVVIWLYSRWAR